MVEHGDKALHTPAYFVGEARDCLLSCGADILRLPVSLALALMAYVAAVLSFHRRSQFDLTRNENVADHAHGRRAHGLALCLNGEGHEHVPQLRVRRKVPPSVGAEEVCEDRPALRWDLLIGVGLHERQERAGKRAGL